MAVPIILTSTQDDVDRTVDPDVIWEGSGNWGSTEAAFSPDGKRVIVQSFGGVFMYDIETGDKLWESNSTGFPLGVKFSQNGRYVVVDGGYSLFLFDPNSSTPLWRAEVSGSLGNRGKVMDISDGGERIVVGRTGQELSIEDPPMIYIFSASSNVPLVEFETTDIVNSVAISPDGMVVVAGTEDGHLYFFVEGNSEPVIVHVGSSVNAVVISAEWMWYWIGGPRYLTFVGTVDGRVLSFDGISTRASWIRVLSNDPVEVLDLRLVRYNTGTAGGSSTLFAGSSDGYVYVFDIRAQNPAVPTKKVFTGIYNWLLKTIDNRQFFMTTDLIGNGTVILWDVESDTMLKSRQWERVESIDITRDGRRYLMSTPNGVIVYKNDT